MGISTIGSAFYLNANYESIVYADSNIYSYCLVSGKEDNGGGIYNINSNISMVENNGTYNFTAALQGGIYYCDGCKLSVNNSRFY